MKNTLQMILSTTLLLASLPGPACADPAVTTWTAYLYEGPDSHYAVVDEVPQATALDVANCSGDWCKVTIHHRTGYLRAEIVAKGDASKPAGGLLPQPAAAVREPSPKGPCVEANQTGGNGGNAPTIFCTK